MGFRIVALPLVSGRMYFADGLTRIEFRDLFAGGNFGEGHKSYVPMRLQCP